MMKLLALFLFFSCQNYSGTAKQAFDFEGNTHQSYSDTTEAITIIKIDNTTTAPIAFFYIDPFDNMGIITKPPMAGLEKVTKKIIGNSAIILRYSLQNRLVVPFILIPGDSIEIGFSEKLIPVVRYSRLGNVEKYNIFSSMAQKGAAFFTMAHQFIQTSNLINIDSLYKNDSTNMAAIHPGDSAFASYLNTCKNYLQCQYYLFALQRDKKMPNASFMANDANLPLHNFRELLTAALYIKNANGHKKEAVMMEIYYQAAMAAQGEIKNYLLYYISKWIKQKNRPLFEKYKQSFVQNCTSNDYVQDLIAEIEPSKASDFYAFNNGKKNSFAGIIKANKGNVIYIDVWASWCAPCRAAMETSRQLQQQYKGNAVTFLYVSIDSDLPAWQKAVKEEGLELSSSNYLIANQKESGFVKQFKVSSIPRYLIYDKYGKLITEAAPAPYDKALIPLLNKLLKNK
jgi:thiol-disulfide isomerase/thioredoxin